MKLPFQQTKELVIQVDEFLDTVSEGALVFHKGVEAYLAGDSEDFERRRQQISDLENRADNLSRQVENHLYRHSLIPEHRGDVLGLLEHMDDIIDTAKETLLQFSVEVPEIPSELNNDYLALAQASTNATEAVAQAARAFFKNVQAVNDHLHKVHFYEKEADTISENLKRRVFAMDLPLSHKIHLRYFALHVELVSDKAEDVSDRLAIYAIKRDY
jgi:predicted phosphate transport protein (TIGR00153 family)